VEEGGWGITLEEEEEVMSEEDPVAVLEILVEEVKIHVPANQVVIELTNKTFSVINVKTIDTMHMNAERDSIIRTSKVKISQKMKITKFTLCLWNALK
jgi:hypothetical protein